LKAVKDTICWLIDFNGNFGLGASALPEQFKTMKNQMKSLIKK
jgi:hypothetical protein